MFPIQPEQISKYIVENLNEGAWIINKKMQTQFASERMAEMLCCAPEEMIGTNLADFVFEGEKTKILEKIESSREGMKKEFDFRFRRKDGSSLWARVLMTPLYGDSGEFVGTLGMVTDLTELKQTEEEARKQENQLRLINDNLPALISYVDKEHRYRFVNKTYLDWFGREPEEVLGKHISEILGESAYRTILPEIERTLTGEKITFERLLPYKDKGAHFVRISYIPDIDSEGNVNGYFALVIDITDEKRVEENLEKTEERYRAFVTQSSEAIWRVEMEEPISIDLSPGEQIESFYKYAVLAECNDAMAKMYGYRRAEEITGARLGELLPQADESNVEYLKTFIASGYRLKDAESHEIDRDGQPKFFLNNLVGFIENGYIKRVWGTQRDITESKIAEQALRRSEERYRLVAETASDAIITIDEDSKILYVNAAAERIFGHKIEEMVGHSLTKLMPESLRESHRKGITHYLKTGKRRISWKSVEVPALHADGHTFPLEISFAEYNENERRFFIGIARDITERKKTEEILRENQMMLSLSMRSSRMGAWEHDIATDTVWWSEELEEIFGLKKGSFAGTRTAFYDLIYEEDRPRIWVEIKNAVTEQKDYVIEFRFYHADGSIRWMEGRGQAVYSEKGEPVRLYGVGIDITERKKAEETRAQLAAVVESSADAIYSYDFEGRLLSWNKSAEKLYGYKRAEIVGQHITRLTPDGFVNEPSRIIAEIKKNKPLINLETKRMRKNGSIFDALMTASPIKDASGRPAAVSVILRDISQRKEAEKALRESEERFSKAFNSSPLVLAITNLKTGKLIEVNETFINITGYKREEAIGRTTVELGLWADSDEREKELAAVRKEGKVRNLEYRFRMKDGREITGLLSAELIEIGGEPCSLTVIQDITDRKRAEYALVEGARRQEALYQLANHLHRAKTLDELYEAALQAVAGALKCDRTSILLYDKTNVMRFVAWRGLSEDYRRAVEGHSPWQPDEKNPQPVCVNDINTSEIDEPLKSIIKKEGIAAFAFIPLISNERLIGKLMMYFDEPHIFDEKEVELGLTIARQFAFGVERKNAEEALRESEELYRTLFDLVPVAVYTCDKTGVIQEFNQRAAELWGREPKKGKFGEKFCGSYKIYFPDGSFMPHEKCPMARVLRGETLEEKDSEILVEQPDGSRKSVIAIPQTFKNEQGEITGAINCLYDITERKQIEEQLKYQLDLTQTITENTQSCLLMMDAEGRGTFANYATERITGFKPEELIGEILHNKIHHTHPDGTPFPIEECPLDNALPLQEAVVGYEDVFVHKDGHFYPVRCAGRPIFKEGKPIGTVIEVQDITEEKRAQEALLKAERKAADEYHELLQRIVPLGQTLGTARNLISIYRAVHEFICSSMSCSAFFISSFDAENNLRVAEYVWGEGEEVDISSLPPMPLTPGGGANSQAVFQKETVITNNFWSEQKKHPHVILCENGKNPMSSLVVPMMIKNEVVGTLEVQAHENEAFSQEQAVALEMVANLAAVAIENVRLLDTEAAARQEAEQRWREGEILQSVSRKLVGALELEEVTTVICQAVRDLLHSDGATFVLHEEEKVRYTDENAIAPLWKGSSFPIECCISGWSIRERQPAVIEDIYQDQRIPHDAYRQTFVKSLAMMPVGPDEPIAAIGAYWATSHKATKYEIGLLKSLANLADLALSNARSYDEMRRARHEAEAANRAKDEFLSVLSHELRTPLNAMLGWIRMLRIGMLDEERSEQAIEVIERNTRLQNSLIEDLLDVSRIISGKMRIETESVDLASIVKDSVEVLRPSASQKNLEFEFSVPDEALMLDGDATRLQQIVNNLVQNAIKFTPEGKVEVLLRRAGDKARLVVKDTGVGIERDLLPFVFERFRQADASTKRSFSGLGLGLTIVQNLVELHGGTIKAESEGAGRGAVFTIEFPLANYQVEDISSNGETSPEEEPALKGARILLVDDDSDSLIPLQILLEKEKAEVVSVNTAEEALKKLSTGNFHILISDIGMPETDGYDLISKVRQLTIEQNAFLPAIALTAYASNDDRRRALTAGFQRHFSKPVNFDEFLETIKEIYLKAS